MATDDDDEPVPLQALRRFMGSGGPLGGELRAREEGRRCTVPSRVTAAWLSRVDSAAVTGAGRWITTGERRPESVARLGTQDGEEVRMSVLMRTEPDLAEADPEVASLVAEEVERQSSTICLIPS